MEFKEVCLRIKEIIKNQIKVDLNNDDLLLDNGVDSVSMINIVVDIENFFDIDFEPQDLNYKTLRTITDIANYINMLQR